jgi:hypothetical protein
MASCQLPGGWRRMRRLSERTGGAVRRRLRNRSAGGRCRPHGHPWLVASGHLIQRCTRYFPCPLSGCGISLEDWFYGQAARNQLY